MIKLVFCLRRLSDLTREEFQRYWRETHAPLVRERSEALNIRRYVQLHSLDHAVNEALSARRGGPEPYDGIAELWFDSIESFIAGGASDEGRRAAKELLEDEKRFIDLERSPLWIAEENPVVG